MTQTLKNTLDQKIEILIKRIQGLGIKRNCRDYYEYNRAKRVIGSLASSPSEDDRLNRIVVDYVGI